MNTETYALGGAYLKAKKSGFSFCKAEDRFMKCMKAIQAKIDKMQESPSFYQSILSILAVFVALGLGYLEATNCSQGISSLGVSEDVSYYVGWVLCCCGLLAGEKLGEGLRALRRNEFTGKPILNDRIIAGGVLTIIYLAAQFSISYAAYSESGSSFFIVIYVMLISLFELLVGAIFLKQSLSVVGNLFSRFGIMLSKLRSKLIIKRMNSTAKATEYYWQRYLFDLSKSAIPVT